MKKRLFILCIIALVMLVGGSLAISMPDRNTKNTESADAKAVSEELPSECDHQEAALSFASFEDICSAKLSDNMEADEEALLDSVSGIYFPNELPKTAVLKNIVVTDDSRIVTYSVPKDSSLPAIGDSEVLRLQTQFKIIEYVSDNPEELMISLLKALGSTPVEAENDVYISEVQRRVTDRAGNTHKIVAAKELVWTNGSSLFYGCFPATFNIDTMVSLTNVCYRAL